MTWTSSSLTLFRECPRKFFWSYMVRLNRRAKEVPLWIGELFHAGLYKWYRQRRAPMWRIAHNLTEPAFKLAQKTADLYGQEDYDKLRHGLQTLTGMLLGYEAVYASDRTTMEYERNMVEIVFRVDRPHYAYAGMIDLLTACMPGSTKAQSVLWDHKTTSRIDTNLLERLPLDTQMRGYVFGAANMGIKVQRVVYDIVKKCALRRKQDETATQFDERVANDYMTRPDFYFHREDLVYSKDDVAAFQHELEQTDAYYRMIASGKHGDPTDPRSWPINDKHCMAYFRPCPYLTLCTTQLDRGTARMFQQREHLHEELGI